MKLTTAILAGTCLLLSASAQAQTASGYEKKNYNYSEWTKGLFSEVVTVSRPGKMIFLAGVGAEDEGANRGVIRHLGDFDGQCRYAYDEIKRLLAAHGASMNDVVKVVNLRDRHPQSGSGRQMPGGSLGRRVTAGAHIPEHQPARMARHASGNGRDRDHQGLAPTPTGYSPNEARSCLLIGFDAPTDDEAAFKDAKSFRR